MSALRITLARLHKIENGLLVLSLSALALLACLDIAARVIGFGDFAWIAPFLRILVLWLGLQGAMIATRTNEHITIDVLGQYLPERIKHWVSAIVLCFSSLICAIIARYSVDFLALSIEYADTTFADLPIWPFQLILPLSFALMSLRFLIQAVINVVNHNQPQGSAA